MIEGYILNFIMSNMLLQIKLIKHEHFLGIFLFCIIDKNCHKNVGRPAAVYMVRMVVSLEVFQKNFQHFIFFYGRFN